jgi:hypothetical protein
MAELYNRISSSSAEENEITKKLWNAEDLGGTREDNNRVPMFVVMTVVLTIITAFLITAPLWGQRPTAAIYVDYVKAMDTPEIQAIVNTAGDAAAMAELVKRSANSPHARQLIQHPVTMDDMRMVKPQIESLIAKGADLRDYSVIGPIVKIANFEGNFREDGSRMRQQPSWDKGYTIDIFFVLAFYMGVAWVTKRLPPSTWQPVHSRTDNYK